jgi:phosphoglucosamine mutase
MKLFGTDGIRGRAGVPPLEPQTVARIGAALVLALAPEADPSTFGQAQGRPEQDREATQQPDGTASPSTSHAPRVLIGRDTRESGTWIEAELARGLVSEGARVASAGVVPTPAVAYLAGTEAFDVGIVISASHNPYEDNGIKVFSGTGVKVTQAVERDVESLVADRSWIGPGEANGPGAAHPTVHVDPDLATHYLTHLRQILPDAGPLAGWPIVIDCANGATAPHAQGLFRSLGFDVKAIGADPNGRNINLNCGSTHLESLASHVTAERARLGIAFDGDGDRTLMVDHTGRIVDGDAILLMAARHLQHAGRLPQSTIVATVMSNIGLEIALAELGITMVRCPVGDKYVMEEMSRRGLALGGEQSGHIILAEHLFTGDGMATALFVLRMIAESRVDLADLAAAMVSYPQVLVNVRVREKADYMQVPAIAELVHRVESDLAGQGRLLVRYSGTEPLLRIMLEGKDDAEIRAWADEIAGAVRAHLG